MMKRRRVRRLAVAIGAAGLLFAGSHLSAQTPRLGETPGILAHGPAEDEISPRLVAGPNGEIFRMWLRVGDTRRGGGAVLLALAKPQDAWQTLLEIRPSEPGVSFRDPYIAVAPSNRLAVFYRWRTDQPRLKRIRSARSDDGGKTWTHASTPVDTSSQAFDPKAVWTRDGSLVVVWSDERRGQRLFDVYARRSPDGGKTWEPEQVLSRFPRQLPGDVYARPVLLGDGQDRLWTVWVGIRSGRSSLFLNSSLDGGRFWTEPVALSGEDSQSVFGQILQRAGKHMLLVWQDSRTGRDRVYAVNSADDGVTWSPAVRVDHLPADSQTQLDGMQALLSPSGEGLVAWHDARNGRDDIFLARSADMGRTWGSEDHRMDMDEPGTAVSRYPALARAADGRLAIAWEDDRAGYEGIYLRVRSTGERPAWGPEVVVASPSQKRAMRVPQLLWGSDGALYAAWEVWDHTLGATNITKQVDSRVLRPSLQ